MQEEPRLRHQGFLVLALSQANPQHKKKHPRSGYRMVRGDWWNTDYGCWDSLPFSYGPATNDIKRPGVHNLCVSGNRFRDREKISTIPHLVLA